VNPVPVNGDFIKVFEYQGVPAVDDIYFLGRSNRGTRCIVGGIQLGQAGDVRGDLRGLQRDRPEDRLQGGMDQYAMGVNCRVTSGGPGVWNAPYVPRFNRFSGAHELPAGLRSR